MRFTWIFCHCSSAQKCTHCQNSGRTVPSVRWVSVSQVQGPTPSLSRLQHSPQIRPRPRYLFVAGEAVLAHLCCSWDWTQYPALGPWSLCLGHTLEPSNIPGQLISKILGEKCSLCPLPSLGHPEGDALFFHENRCPMLSFLRDLSRWFRRVEIIIEKKRGSHTCGSLLRFPYLPDISTFPRRRKGWVILEVGKKQEKEL